MNLYLCVCMQVMYMCESVREKKLVHIRLQNLTLQKTYFKYV